MNTFKKALLLIPFFNSYKSFRKIYNEPNSSSLWKFCSFYFLPIYILKYIYNREEYLPHDKYSSIIRGNVFIGICSRIQRSGCYIQGRGKVFIGDYVEMASNVCIISGNHDSYNQDESILKETIIGDNCWIASNASILAGVVLGPRTIVGAGSVVTKSFPEGFCIVAGNPAKLIRHLDKDKVIFPKYKEEFYGYIHRKKFHEYFNCHYTQLKFDYPIHNISNNEYFKNE